MTPSSFRAWNLFGTAVITICLLLLFSGPAFGQDEDSQELEQECPEYQIWQNETEECAGIFLERGNISNCDMKNTTIPCVLNAGCNPLNLPSSNATGTEGFCVCSPDFVPEPGLGTCTRPIPGLTYDEHCDDKVSFCSITQGLKCDPAIGRCRCRFDDDVHYSSIERCKSLADAVCNWRPIDGTHRDCHRNSTCLKFDEKLPYGLCKCNERFCPDKYRICSTEACSEPTEEPPETPAPSTTNPTTSSDASTGTSPETRPTIPGGDGDGDGNSATMSKPGVNFVTIFLAMNLCSILMYSM